MAEQNVKVALILSAYDKMSRVVNESVGKSVKALDKFKKAADKVGGTGGKTGAIGGMITAAAVYEFGKNAEEMAEKYEGVAISMKQSMTNAAGQTAPAYGRLIALSGKLSESFSGGKSQMIGMMNSLINTGMNANNITEEFAKSVLDYGRVMGIPYDEAATLIGKVGKMGKIAQKDMAALPDLLSRMKILGVSNAEDIASAVGKSGMGVMGMGGIENMQAMSAIIVKIQQATGGAARAGQGMQMIMAKLADPVKMEKFNAELAKSGIRMKFFGKNGKFLGIENMVAQLGQVPASLRQGLFSKMFGGKGAVASASIADLGITGYKNTLKKMADQQSLASKSEERGKLMTEQLSIAMSKLKGVMTGLGLELLPTLTKIANQVKDVTVAFMGWYESNKFLGGVLKYVVIGMGALKLITMAYNFVVLGSIRNVGTFAGGLIKFAKFVRSTNDTLYYHILNIKTYSKNVLSAIKAGAAWVKQMAVSMWNGIKRAALAVVGYAATLWTTYMPPVIAAATATWAWATATLAATWPILAIIGVVALLAAGVYLLIKHWSSVTAFFSKVWEKVKVVFGQFMQWFKGWGKYLIVPLMPFIGIPLLIIQNWSKITAFFAKIWAGIKGSFSKAWNWIASLGSTFYNAGSNIVKSIWNGIKAMASKPVEAIKAIVTKIRNFLPFSPAKEGPLATLHRVRIVETIAASMKATPITKAMKGIASGIEGQSYKFNGGGSGSSVVINYSPTISIPVGSGNDVKSAFADELKKHSSELMRIFENVQARKEMRRY